MAGQRQYPLDVTVDIGVLRAGARQWFTKRDKPKFDLRYENKYNRYNSISQFGRKYEGCFEQDQSPIAGALVMQRLRPASLAL